MKYYTQGTMMEYIAARTVEAKSEEEAIEKAKEEWEAEGRDIKHFDWWARSEEKLRQSHYQYIPVDNLLRKPPYWSGGYRH